MGIILQEYQEWDMKVSTREKEPRVHPKGTLKSRKDFDLI